MKKLLFSLVVVMLLTGCNSKKEETKKQGIIGSWTTKYELSVIGEVSESYVFKEKGKCVRILNAGSDIVDECTYEIKDNEIRIIWDNKIDKESFSKYVEITDNKILIGEHTFEREEK